MGGLLNPYARAPWLTLTVEGLFLNPNVFMNGVKMETIAKGQFNGFENPGSQG
jgi:hypothetical protein